VEILEIVMIVSVIYAILGLYVYLDRMVANLARRVDVKLKELDERIDVRLREFGGDW